jgi:hypothetical protein
VPRLVFTSIAAFSIMAALAVSAPQATAASAPLLQNGDFQAGNFAGWSLNAQYTSVLSQPYDGYSPVGGSTYAILGPVGTSGTLYQSFNDTACQTLTISFDLASDGGEQNDFIVIFDHQTLLSLTNIAADRWTEYDFTVAATGTDSLEFAFRDDPGYLGLDDIAVTPTSVPEPATLFTFSLGLAGLAMLRGVAWRCQK